MVVNRYTYISLDECEWARYLRYASPASHMYLMYLEPAASLVDVYTYTLYTGRTVQTRFVGVFKCHWVTQERLYAYQHDYCKC